MYKTLICAALASVCSAYAAVITTPMNKKDIVNLEVGVDKRAHFYCGKESGDRIKQFIYDDKSATHTEADGHIFFRQNTEGVNHITVITEKESSQTFTLNVRGSKPLEVVLDSDEPYEAPAVTQNRSSEPYIKTGLEIIKKSKSDKIPNNTDVKMTRHADGFKIDQVSGHKIGHLHCYVYDVRNDTGTEIMMHGYEDRFFVPGDIAISVECALLKPGCRSKLYVIGA